jgi:hypothetical protein
MSGDVMKQRKPDDLVIRTRPAATLSNCKHASGEEQLSYDARCRHMFADVLDAACKLYEDFSPFGLLCCH